MTLVKNTETGSIDLKLILQLFGWIK